MIMASHSNTKKFALDTGYLIGVPDIMWEICRLVGENVLEKRVQKETTRVAFVA